MYYVMLLLFTWTSVRGVCLIYEMVMFQPQTVTPLYLGFIVTCYVSYSTLLNPLRPSLPSAWFPSGGGCPHPPLATLPSTSVVHPHRIIRPPGHHLSPSHNTKACFSLHQTPLPPWLPCPFHACRIPNSAPFPPPKYLLPSHSYASDPPFSATVAHDASPLLHRLSSCRKPQVLASTPLVLGIMEVNCNLMNSYYFSKKRWIRIFFGSI